MTGTYNFLNTDYYQNRTDTNGIFRPLQLGYIDTLKRSEKWRYFFDPGLSSPFTYPPDDSLYSFDDKYWSKQPRIQILKHMPKHNMCVQLHSSLRYNMPKLFTVKCQGGVQLQRYIGKVQWYAIDQQSTRSIFFAKQTPFDIHNNFRVVYVADNAKYYLHTNPFYKNCNPDDLEELKLYKKTRADCYISITMTIDRNFKYIGDFFISGSFIKGYSTLDDNGPVSRLNYVWQVTGGLEQGVLSGKTIMRYLFIFFAALLFI